VGQPNRLRAKGASASLAVALAEAEGGRYVLSRTERRDRRSSTTKLAETTEQHAALDAAPQRGVFDTDQDGRTTHRHFNVVRLCGEAFVLCELCVFCVPSS
jgi:hypothetical protein